MDSDKYVSLFVSESREHLEQCTAQLLEWERSPAAVEPRDALFRSIHTIKGMSATLGFGRLTQLLHATEHLLARLRDEGRAATSGIIDLCFRAVDVAERGVALAASGEDDRLDAVVLLTELESVLGLEPVETSRPLAAGAAAPEGRPIRVQLRPGVAMPAARAAIVLRCAASLGEVLAIDPPPDEWLLESFDGAFTVHLRSEATGDHLRRVLLRAGDVAEVRVEGDVVQRPRGKRQVKVDMDRLDRLVRLTGEIVVARGRIATIADGLGDVGLEAAGHELSRLIGELQAAVLSARMAPVAEVYKRFARPVRDLSRQLGKSVRLDLAGGEIELDRAILDELSEPLLHLLRNAIDHGIENPTDRTAAGKPAEGAITVSAHRERNMVVITVKDDGRGIDEEAVRARTGWSAPLDGSSGLLEVIAKPGFSTARTVTDVSGRGVGIDAVVHWSRSRGGTTELGTRWGVGTTVTLRLPLAVAIIPALLVGVTDHRFAVPLGFVAETVRLPTERHLAGIAFRGDRVPILETLGPRRGRDGDQRPWRPGVVIDVGGRLAALAVDTLLGQEDIVVGPVDAPRGTPAWINGATILADGRPVLILDPAVLIQGEAP